jgi:hypothetical protein
MTAEQLLRLYPRRWRERYGEEFLDTAGREALRLQQVIDIVAGAIDAHLSRDSRRAIQATDGGTHMTRTLKAACARTELRYTTRDAVIGAAVMIASTIVLSLAGILASRLGDDTTGEVLKSLAFPASVLFSMPFVWLKGQPWKPQAVLVGVPLTILIAISWLATRF